MKTDAIKRHPDYLRIFYALLFSSLVATLLIIIGAQKSKSGYYYFLIYNMGLAYIPLLVAWWLTKRLQKNAWLSPGNIVLTILWFGFLPNSFYMITDLIHVQSSIGYDLLYNIVVVLLCAFNALVAGYISLYLIHWEFLKRFYYRYAHIAIGIIIFLCSFAIYLGRYLRWNSWDVVFNPFGLLFDVTDSIASPSTHPDVFVTTITFFLMLTSMYIVIWQLTRVLRKTK
jgi:uncharacterized membrane protein